MRTLALVLMLGCGAPDVPEPAVAADVATTCYGFHLSSAEQRRADCIRSLSADAGR